jgi:hypothetical protein
MLRLAFRPAEHSHFRGKGTNVKSLVSTCAAASLAIPPAVSFVGVVALALLITVVVATALFSCSKRKRSEAALAVLRLLLRTLIAVCILLYWLHR